MKITIHKNGVDYPVEANNMQDAMAAADALEKGNPRTTGEQVGRDIKAGATGVRQFGEGMVGLPGDTPGMMGGTAKWLASVADRLPFVEVSPEQQQKFGQAAQGAGDVAMQGISGQYGAGYIIKKALEAAGLMSPEKAEYGTNALPTSQDVHGAVSSVLDKGGRIGERLNEATSYQPTNTQEKLFNLGGNLVPGMATGTSELTLAKGASEVPAMVKALTTRFGARVAAPTVALTGAEIGTDKAVKAGFITPDDATAIKTVVGALSAAPAGALERNSAMKAAASQVTRNPQALQVVYEYLTKGGRTHESAMTELKSLGADDAMLVDLGANMQQLGIVASSAPGTGREAMHERLIERQAQEGARLRGIKEEAMGPGGNRVQLKEDIGKKTDVLGPKYDTAHDTAQLSPVDSQHIIDQIDTDLGAGQIKSNSLRKVLLDIRDNLHIKDRHGTATPNLDPSSRGLQGAREAIDAETQTLAGKNMNLTPVEDRLYTKYRNLINAEMDKVNPDVRALDTQYKAASDERRAFTTGEDALKKRGTETMTHPEFKTAWDKMTPEQQTRAVEGASRHVEITMGLSPTERTTLKSMLGGDLNEAKLTEMIGPEKTAAFYKGLEKQDVFHESFQKIVKGTKATEQLKAEPGSSQGAVETGLSAAVYSGDVLTGIGAGLTKAAYNILRDKLAKTSAQKANAKLKSDVATLLANPDPESILKASAKMQQATGKSALPSAMLNALVARRAGGPR